MTMIPINMIQPINPISIMMSFQNQPPPPPPKPSKKNNLGFKKVVVQQISDFDNEQQQEIKDWIRQRSKNYPTKKIQEQKKVREQKLHKLGIQTKESLSKLEIKLKRKIRLISSMDDRNFQRKQKLFKDVKNILEQKTYQKKEPQPQQETEQIQSDLMEKIKDLQMNLTEENQQSHQKKIKRKIQKLKKRGQIIKKVNTTNDQSQIIEMLKQSKQQEEQVLGQFIDSRNTIYSETHVYKKDNLLGNLLIDQIFQEKCILLQALQYIQNEHFFEENEGVQQSQNEMEECIQVNSQEQSQSENQEKEEGEI